MIGPDDAPRQSGTVDPPDDVRWECVPSIGEDASVTRGPGCGPRRASAKVRMPSCRRRGRVAPGSVGSAPTPAPRRVRL